MTEKQHRLDRRRFLVRGGLLVGATTVAGVAGHAAARGLVDRDRPTVSASPPSPHTWEEVRAQFALHPERVQLASFLLASHLLPVRTAIERHRQGLDADPSDYLAGESALEDRVLQAAADYVGGDEADIALTDSTTMGLGLLYGSIGLREGDEIVTTEHDHYATHESFRLTAARSGVAIRHVRLYGAVRDAGVDEIVESLRRAVTPRTRIVAITWVHSGTGLKLPVRAIAEMLRAENDRRDRAEHALLCVDGVHGFGVEDVRAAELGCDFFVSGCHKWLFGPRGTGLVWGRSSAWPRAAPIIPTFDGRSYVAWIEGRTPTDLPPGAAMTPGGFHSFEHRWALAEAFEFHAAVGPERIAARTRALARRLKAGLAEIRGVALVTPDADELSSGIVCFDIDAVAPREVVERLRSEHRVVATVTPYSVEHVRLGPTIVNSPDDVDTALTAVRRVARSAR